MIPTVTRFHVRLGVGQCMLALILAAAATLLFASPALAIDRIILKTGRVVEGDVFDTQKDFIRVRMPDGEVRFYSMREIDRIEHDDAGPTTDPAQGAPSPAAPATPDRPAAPAIAKPDAAPSARSGAMGGTTRMAILPFGPPSSWMGTVGDTVGIQITAQAWRDAIPYLERDRVEVVVVRINSGGGYLAEVEEFHKVFGEYKRKFRTVAWVESAISAAAMSPWVLEEFYFMPEGNIGACTAFSGRLQAVKGMNLSSVLYMMELASQKGRHNQWIMRSMQVPDPLSANISEYGVVEWFPNVTGRYVVNPPGQILTLNADHALKFRFGLGIAGTPAELAEVLGLREFTLVGDRAVRHIERSMRLADSAQADWPVVMDEYQLSLRAAPNLNEREQLVREVGIAKRKLRELERLVERSPRLADNLPDEWFPQQEQILKDLLRR